MHSNSKNYKLLVLGANSFIGKNFLKETKFHNILATYHSILPPKKFINKKYIYKKIDIRNYNEIFNLIKKRNFDIIINFIANNNNMVDRTISVKNIFDLNLFGFINLIESVRVLQKKTIIYHFTSTEVDNNRISPYSLSKYLSEEVQKLYNKLYNMNIHTIKLNNIFGPGDMNFSRLIPFICKNLCDNKKFYLNSNNKKLLKFTYVDDLINFLEDAIANNKINNSDKKIKYHRSGAPNIYKLLCKLNNKHSKEFIKNNFENKLYTTLKWYNENI